MPPNVHNQIAWDEKRPFSIDLSRKTIQSSTKNFKPNNEFTPIATSSTQKRKAEEEQVGQSKKERLYNSEQQGSVACRLDAQHYSCAHDCIFAILSDLCCKIL
jgi:hypothetical protein